MPKLCPFILQNRTIKKVRADSEFAKAFKSFRNKKFNPMKKIIITSLLSFMSIFGFSQFASDALRYSNLSHNGDARFMSMGGAFGALGGNISSFNYNPAGIGLYRRSDASVTFSFLKNKNTGIYNSEMNRNTQDDFLVSSVGVVITNDYLKASTGSGLASFQFGISYNILKNFNNLTYVSGPNTTNSIGDMYAALANGLSIADIEDDIDGINAFDLNPAWYSFLFDESDTPGSYIGNAPLSGVLQSKRTESWGSLDEVALTFGANYDDKLYLGATIGLPILNYHEISTYTEDALSANIPDYTYRSAMVKDYLDTKAYGINLKLGVIYKANDMLRFGAAIHTSTYYYEMNDEWSTSIGSDWDIYDSNLNDSPTGYVEYHLSTPMKAIGSVALIFNKSGLISLDYEYVDYSNAEFSADGISYDSENNSINTSYKATSNIRLGTEWKFMNFAFRGGYSLYGSPYKNEANNGKKSSYSLGAGYREGNFYLDIAWVYSETDAAFTMYNYNGITTNPATISNKNTNLLFTLGARF